MANTFNHNDKVVITDGGSVGIGTTSPTVYGSKGMEVASSGGQTGIRVSNSGTGKVEIGADSSGGFIQTAVSGNGLAFYTGNASPLVMKMTSAGNVGIGTTSTVSTNLSGSLTIYKSYNGDTSSVPSVTAQNYYGNQSALYLFGRNSTLTLVGSNGENNNIVFANASTPGYAKIGTFNGSSSAGGDMYFNTGGDVERMRITSAGNVGIGTTDTLNNKLLISGAHPSGYSILGIKSGGDQVATLGLYNSGGVRKGLIYTTSNYLAIESDGLPLYFNPNGSVKGVWDTAGNVGIGTTSPATKLDIAGAHVSSIGLLRLNSSAGNISAQTYYIDGVYKAAVYASIDNNFFLWGRDGDTVFSTTVSNTERMRITSAGNVGIGTSSPATKLDVALPSDGTAGVIFGYTGGSNNPRLFFNVNESTSKGQIILSGSSGALDFGLGAGGAEIITLKGSGNVGIGTTNPTYKLDVYGNIRSGGADPVMLLQPDSGTYTFFQKLSTSNGDYLRLYDGTSYSMFWKGGNVGIGTTSPQAKLQVSGTGRSFNVISSDDQVPASITCTNNTISTIGFQGTTSTSDYHVRVGANGTNFVAYTNDTERMRITSAGNVGIGTTSPTEKLQVNGNIYTTNNVFLGASGNYSKLLFYRYEGSAVGGMGWHTDNKFYVGGFPDWGQNAGDDVRIYGFGALLSLGSATAGDVLNITTSGNVGIATTSPSSRLHVVYSNGQGTPSNFSGNVATFQTNNATGYDAYISVIGGDTGASGILFGDKDAMNRGIVRYNNASDYLGLGAAGNNTSLVIDSSGNVGIGTTSPSAEANLSLGAKAASEGGQLTLNKGTSYSHATHIDNYADSFRIMYGTDGGSSAVQFLLNHGNGNVGIGTTSPAYKLDVYGSARLYGGDLDLRETNQEDATNVIYFNANNGNAANDSNDIGTGIVWKPNYAGYSKRSAGIMQIGEGNYFKSGIAFYTNNTSNESTDWSERMRLDMDGNLGIGTTAPGTKLDVVGKVRLGPNTSQSLHAALNVSAGEGSSSLYRDIDIHGSWSTGEAHAITATYSSQLNYTVGQMVFQYTSPGSRIRWGAFYHNGQQTTYPMELVSDGNNGNLILTGKIGVGNTSPSYSIDVSGGAIAIRGNTAGNSLRFDDTTATSRNAMYVDTSNYLNVGNANYAGLKLYHTATAPQANGLQGNQIAEGFGTTENGKVLAEPTAWLAVRIGTTNYAIPMYSVG